MGLDGNGTDAAANCTVVNGTVTNGSVCGGPSSRFTHLPEGYVLPFLFALIFIVGVLGNGTLIFIVLRNKVMRNVPNIFIVSLAFGDLLLILVSVPFTATIYTFTEWPYGNFVCKLNEFLQALSLGVSVFTLTALSADRFVAIVDPMKRHRTSSLGITLAVAGAIWTLSAALASIELFAAHTRTKNFYGTLIEVCEIHPPHWGEWYPKAHAVVRFVVYFAIPMVIIGVLYLLMALILLSSGRRFPGEVAATQSQQQQRQLEARRKVAKVVLSFVVVFIICWLPRHIYLLWFFFDPGLFNLFWHVFKIIGFCLTFINSCVNPLALYFLSKQFRKFYNHYLLCCVVRKRPAADQEYSNMYNFKDSTVRRTSTTMTMLPSQSMC